MVHTVSEDCISYSTAELAFRDLIASSGVESQAGGDCHLLNKTRRDYMQDGPLPGAVAIRTS